MPGKACSSTIFAELYKWTRKPHSSGNTSRRELAAGISRTGASRDANAPTSLTAEQCAETSHDPQLIALRPKRSELVSQIKANHQYVEDAVGTNLHKQYMNKGENQRALRRKLEKGVLEESQEAYFRDIHYNEINRQLEGCWGSYYDRFCRSGPEKNGYVEKPTTAAIAFGPHVAG